MAKWIIEFEDTYMENGEPAVQMKASLNGEAVVNGGWTPATCCALMLDYQWAHEIFQKNVHENMDVVAEYQIGQVAKNQAMAESSSLSDEG